MQYFREGCPLPRVRRLPLQCNMGALSNSIAATRAALEMAVCFRRRHRAAQLPDDALSKQFLLAFVDALSCRNGTELTAVSLFWNAITEPGSEWAIRRHPKTTLPLSVLQSGNGGNDDPLLSTGYQMVCLRGDTFS